MGTGGVNALQHLFFKNLLWGLSNVHRTCLSQARRPRRRASVYSKTLHMACSDCHSSWTNRRAHQINIIAVKVLLGLKSNVAIVSNTLLGGGHAKTSLTHDTILLMLEFSKHYLLGRLQYCSSPPHPMCMFSLLEAASSFLLLVPGFLPLLFFAQSRLVGSTLLAKPAPVVCTFVFSLGPLAAVAAALGLTALAFNPQCESLRVAQTIVQSLVELGCVFFHYSSPPFVHLTSSQKQDRASILYLITPRSFAVLASRISLSQTEICRHNTILAAIHFAS